MTRVVAIAVGGCLAALPGRAHADEVVQQEPLQPPRPIVSVLATVLAPGVSVNLEAIPWVDLSAGFFFALVYAGLHFDVGPRITIFDHRAPRPADGASPDEPPVFEGETITVSILGGWATAGSIGGTWTAVHGAVRLDRSWWFSNHFALTASATVEGYYDPADRFLLPMLRLGGGCTF